MAGVPRKPRVVSPWESSAQSQRGNILPFETNLATGDSRPAVPQALLDLWSALTLPGDAATGANGMQDLYQDPETGTVSPNLNPDLIARAAGFPLEVGMPGLMTGASQVAKEGLDPNLLSIFAGPKGKTADLDKLAEAKDEILRLQMLHGRTGLKVPEINEIFDETGWLLAPDGRMKYEISDDPAVPTKHMPVSVFDAKMDGYLSDFISHPELFDAYPELKGHSTEVDIRPGPQEGFYDPSMNLISAAGRRPFDVASVLMHETQHKVQELEGFARGGSPNGVRHMLANLEPNASAQLSLPDPMQLYKALMGEAEARMVQRRFETGDNKKSPYGTGDGSYDVPASLQIDPKWMADPAKSIGQDELMKKLLSLKAALQ